MSFSASKVVINILPNELEVWVVVGAKNQFLKTVPLVYTVEKGKVEEPIFGLVNTLLLDTIKKEYETYQIFNKNCEVIVNDSVFLAYLDYLYNEILGFDDWRGKESPVSNSSQPVLIFQHFIEENNLNSFANRFRKIVFDHGLKIPIFQLDTDLVTSMFYSTNATIEKSNIVVNLQESFSSISVYSKGIEIYKKKSLISGSYLNFQLAERGVVTSSSSLASSTKHWQDSYSWLNSCRGFMLNFVPLENGSFDFDTLKQYYNSKNQSFLNFSDQDNSLKIELKDLEKIKREYLYIGFGNEISIQQLINDSIDNSLPLKIQLYNKNEQGTGSENPSSDFVHESSESTFTEYLQNEYPKKEKSYSYKISKNSDPEFKAVINKIIVRIGANLSLIPFFSQVVTQLVRDKLSERGYSNSDFEVIIDEDFNSSDIVNKFASNCNDREVLLALNKN
ncbi:hypothetical protein QEN19_003505 [Hanseniaspora menglaensis]